MVNYFQQLYLYDNEMNRQVLEQLRGCKEVEERTRQIFVHLLQAKRIWMGRLRGEKNQDLEIWPDRSWKECAELVEENGRTWLGLLEDLNDDDLEKGITFTTSKGIEYTCSIRDILMHVLVHGGYHRGQIASAMRQAGEEPLLTDYISWTRTR